jgi:AcrR family transcriptional regulator
VPKILSPADIEAFRSRLCDVAEVLFAAHGPDGVTIRQLADAMGVSSMTPYRYFKDKDAILAAVRTRAFSRFAEAMEATDRILEAALARSRKSAPAEKVGGRKASPDERPGNAYLDFALANPAAYRLMFDVNQPTFQNYPDLVAAMDRARSTMGGGLRKLAAEGRFAGDVDLTAHIFWLVMHGAVMLELAGALDGYGYDARTLAQPALEALARQMGVPSSR